MDICISELAILIVNYMLVNSIVRCSCESNQYTRNRIQKMVVAPGQPQP